MVNRFDGGKGAFPFLASYCATKHAVVGFTHSLRAEYGAVPVGFSAICPTFFSEVGMYGLLEGEVGKPRTWSRRFPQVASGRGW